MRSRSSLVLVISSLLAAGALAQQPSNVPTYDAGALMRQTEQAMRQNQMMQGLQKREPLPPAAAIQESTVVQVASFKFSGNKRLTTEQLESATASFLNRPLNAHELQHLTDAVSEAYRQAGWLVRAYIPRQDLSGPELTVQVIETIK